jgi:hypothetical protein
VRLNIKPFRACGKKRYYRPEDAVDAKEKLEAYDRTHRPSATAVNIYFCKTCQAYHVGHIS